MIDRSRPRHTWADPWKDGMMTANDGETDVRRELLDDSFRCRSTPGAGREPPSAARIAVARWILFRTWADG
jgi:hypothetical protein